ncbi:hypothetical protein MCOR25_008763 [Pyricularia grisea]|nr:hypothetical protein MCOR25_008763 [Pyricularia grisea]
MDRTELEFSEASATMNGRIKRAGTVSALDDGPDSPWVGFGRVSHAESDEERNGPDLGSQVEALWNDGQEVGEVPEAGQC